MKNSELQEYFETESLEILHQLKLVSDRQYYEGDSCDLEDFQYDMLKETLQRRDPNYTPPVGSKIREGENRVRLPFWLGSMDKIKPEDTRELDRWLSREKNEEYVIEDKLDGVSCLLVVKNKKLKLYTRGDGVVGADISYLAQYFKSIPKNIREYIAVRGELVMKKAVFMERYSGEYANARNMVAGRVGGKKIREGLRDIDFVAYEIVDLDICMDPYSQIQYLLSLGFKTVNYDVVSSINCNSLSEMFINFKDRSEYEIDGVVVQPNVYKERNTSGNPDYAFAFKMRMDENSAVVEVLDVEWSVSKWGVLKPRVSISPVSLGGVTISYSSGFNAKYIYSNRIGPGAVIRITRSGDVIPYITDVISQAKEPAMPDISYFWNETGVDISTEELEDISEVKRMSSFFSGMGIKHVSEATVNKMYSHGLVTLVHILSSSKSELEDIDGFGERLAERTYDNIHSGLQDVELSLVLGASGIFGFGFGIKKIKSLLSSIPDILVIYKNYTREEMLEKVMSVEGYSDKSSRKIVDNLDRANDFINSLSPYVKFKSSDVSSSGIFDSMKFCLSGFRDAELEKEIVKRGGKMVTSVSKNTSVVIVKVLDSNPSGKVKKALDLGKEVMTKESFEERYF